MIPIKLKNPGDFLKVKETLTRMGVANIRDKVLYQSCHILQKQGEYFIVHFKDMMRLDGKSVNISDEDSLRTRSIAKTLESWNLVETNLGAIVTANNFYVIKHSQKPEWKLFAKYQMGAK